MVKISLYSNNGMYMREWKSNWYDWIWDYTGIQFYISDKLGKNEESKVIVKGGIVIIEELIEEKN